MILSWTKREVEIEKKLMARERVAKSMYICSKE